MKSIVKILPGEGNVCLQDMPEPQPGPKEVKIEVKYAGLCGTDLHIYHDEFPSKPPVILGHEFSGTIVEIGKDVTRYKVGDRVVAENSWKTCGVCSMCRAGRDTLCPERIAVGLRQNGVFAKYVLYKEHLIHKIPDNVDMLSAALTEPLACVVHGVLECSKINTGDVVVVTGPGPIGLLAVQVAKSQGATVVLAGIFVDESRLNIAKELGIDYTVNVEQENIDNLINSLTKNEGADVILECSGNESAAQMGLNLVKKLGIFTQIGLYGKPIRLDFDKINFKELKIYGCLAQTFYAYRRSLKLLSENKVNTKKLVSHVLTLDEWKKGFEIAEKKKGTKIVFKP
jgi:L-iditol 2-dehydrogenase